MPVVETRPEPNESDDQAEAREAKHWVQVEANEKKLLDARERHRRRMDSGLDSDS